MLRIAGLSGLLLAAGACSASGGDGSGRDPLGGTGTGGLGAGVGGAMGGAGNAPPVVGGGTGNAPPMLGIGGNGMRPNETRCDAIVNRGEKAPLDIYIMWDQSLSMNCDIDTTFGPPTRWDVVKGAMQTFLGNPSLSGVGVGIQYFGDDGLASSCDPADYETPDVPIAPLPGNAQPIVDSLNRHGPGTNTPTAAGLQGALNHAVTWKSAHPASKTIVVLVTDGQPNACGAVADVANIARTGNEQHGIPTYVIGVISPSAPCPGIDPNPPNKADLDAVAQAGGTQEALMVDASQNANQFAERLEQIRGSAQIPCQYQIPEPPPNTVFDSKLVNVQFTDAAGQPTTIYYVDNPQACDATTGGWYYDNPAAPTSISLCPATCNVATVTIGITLDIALGCDRIDDPK